MKRDVEPGFVKHQGSDADSFNGGMERPAMLRWIKEN